VIQTEVAATHAGVFEHFHDFGDLIDLME